MGYSKNTSVNAWGAVTALFATFALLTAAGIAAISTPTSRSNQPEWVPITTLHTMPVAPGVQNFPVSVRRTDAWTRLPDEVVGHVFLKHFGDRELTAFSATYHIGSPLEFDEKAKQFLAPCWKDIRFDIDGRRLHSVPEWGDIRRVRTFLAGETVYVKLSDVLDNDAATSLRR